MFGPDAHAALHETHRVLKPAHAAAGQCDKQRSASFWCDNVDVRSASRTVELKLLPCQPGGSVFASDVA
jgi:hypothetical protein